MSYNPRPRARPKTARPRKPGCNHAARQAVSLDYNPKIKSRKMETLEQRKARREAARKSVDKVASDTLAALQGMIEDGTAPWCRPWSLAGNISFATGESYSARNQFCIHLQQLEAEKAHGYTAGPADEYCTWQQLKKEGLLDKLKGHHGAACLAPTIKTFLKATGKFDEDGEEIMEERQFKGYKGIILFNRQELGLPKLHPGPVAHEHGKVEEAERIVADYIARTGITLELTASGDEAYNTHDCQRVQVPRMNRFESVEEYYSTLFHELTHSTAGHGCPRKCHANYHKKTDERAQEEMIAELGAATLCALCGMEKTAEPNSAAYLASWCKGLTRDKAQAFLTALDEAEKAVKLILGKDDQAEDEKPTEAHQDAPEPETAGDLFAWRPAFAAIG